MVTTSVGNHRFAPYLCKVKKNYKKKLMTFGIGLPIPFLQNIAPPFDILSLSISSQPDVDVQTIDPPLPLSQ